jgi:predicted nucleic acid-binding protein
MKVLLDTNIIVDILSRRAGYISSLQIFKRCENKQIEGYISTITITDVVYILRKYSTPDKIREALQNTTNIVDIADITKLDITKAFASAMRDFEDAVQAACAKRIGVNYIVTHNCKDFVGSPVPAILPEEFLGKLKYLNT